MGDRAVTGTARWAVLRLLCGATMISFAPVFVRLAEVPPTTSAFYRTLLGGLVLVVLVKARGGRLLSGGKALAALAAAGLFFALDLWAWHRSIWYVGPGLATLLANFQVFCMALAGILLFRERPGRALWLAIPMALAGLAMIVGFDWSALGRDYRWGIVYGLLTALAYAAYMLSLRSARVRARDVTPAGDLAVASLVSAALLALAAAAEPVSLAIPTLRDGAWLVAYALVAQVLGWVLISGSLRWVPAATVGLLLLLQPTLAFVWDVLFFDRAFGPREGAGALLALFAIYLGSRPRRSGQDAQRPG